MSIKQQLKYLFFYIIYKILIWPYEKYKEYKEYKWKKDESWKDYQLYLKNRLNKTEV